MSSKPPLGYPRIVPYLNYEDVDAMVVWLESVFGFVERHRSQDRGGTTTHAEMAFEDGVVMMGKPAGEFRNPKRLGQSTQSLYICVSDIDTHHERSKRAGAEIIEALTETDYGDRRYGVTDPEGHRWFFASPRILIDTRR